MRYIIRRMQDRDIPQAIEIDREAFPSQWPHPTYSSLKQELRNRLARYIVVCKQDESHLEAVEQNAGNNGFWQRLLQLRHLFDHDRFFGEEMPPPSKEYILAIAGFWVMAGEAHITTIAVRNAYRRQGIAEWLLISVIDMAAELEANMVTLEVRVSNRQAQALYEKYGFQKVGVRRGYYSDDGEDACLMTTDPITSSAFQLLFHRLKEGHQHKRRGLYPQYETPKSV